MTDNKNTILAIVLSAVVLIAWQYFYAMPNAEKQKLAQQQAELQKQAQTPAAPPTQNAQSGVAPVTPGAVPGSAPSVPGQTAPAAAPADRKAALAASPRLPIQTVSLQGSIALKGGRIDDLSLLKFRETVDPKSPPITLLSPSGSPEPFYAEFGWTAADATVKVPTADTLWTQTGSGALDVGHPVTLTWNNGGGLDFTRTITVDDKFLFTVKDEVANKTDKPVDALSLCADLAPRPAGHRRLLHSA